MASKNKEAIELSFPKLNHFWLDSGVLGIYRIAIEVLSLQTSDVKTVIDPAGISFQGKIAEIKTLLECCYWRLLEKHYNRSTQNQIQRNEGFFYDSKKDSFQRFPKVESTPIAKLLRPKYAQPMDDKNSIKYEDAKKYRLPKGYELLQGKLGEFLEEIEKREGKKLPPTGSKLLVNNKNAYQPKKEIADLFKTIKTKGKHCFICGADDIKLVTSGGVFPFLSGPDGALSFNTLASSPQDVCCKCAFIGKFVPMNGFYWSNMRGQSGRDMHMFFPYSIDLQKMNDVYGALHAVEYEDPYLMRNFEHPLGGYFQKPFELTFAFLYTLYLTLTKKQGGGQQEEYELDYQKLFDLILSKAPLEFFVIYTEELGQAQMGKMVWPFQDAVYFFRLIDTMERKGLKIKEVVKKFLDFDQSKNENKSLMRNRICERILKKQSILDLAERHTFHICKSEDKYIAPIYEFVLKYETILKEGGNGMEQTGVDAAVKLGKRIGGSIAGAQNGKKGDLFALRKARKLEDFLNEVSRVQFKYNFSVPTEIYEGYLNKETFAEFKQFCMIAALNTYNGVKYHSESKGGE